MPPPALNDMEVTVDGVSIEVASDCCKVRIPLFVEQGHFNPDLSWRLTDRGNPASQGKPFIHRSRFLPLPEIDPTDEKTKDLPRAYAGLRIEEVDGVETLGETVWEPYYYLELQLLLVVQPPTRKPDPLYFDWESRFFPGGLPSLGKRK